MAQRPGEQGVHRHRQVGAVLLGRAEREQDEPAVPIAQFRDVGPRETF
jgi:hypothetical protein